MSTSIPPIVSVDDHVIEPPHVWSDWLPAKLRDAGPKVQHLPYELVDLSDPSAAPSGAVTAPARPAKSGPMTDFWVYEDVCVPVAHASIAAAGLSAVEIELAPTAYSDMRQGFYEPKARLEDMELNHVERSLCFPTFPRFCGQRFLEARDKDVALACVRAYNDWMVDEWCGDSSGRLIPLCLIPLWDPEAAAAEVRRNSARGVHAVAFCELPVHLGLPSIHDRDGYWEPFFYACEETRTVICMHIGSSSKIEKSSPDAPNSVMLAGMVTNSMLSLADWLLSGVLARHPNLTLAYSESQVGWMPFLLGRVDVLWRKGNKLSEIPPEIVEPPSSYFAGRVYGCIFEDDFGIEVRHSVGINQIVFETDYPHQDTTWPDTRAYAERVMAGLSEDEVFKIIRGNAIEMLSLPLELKSVAS